MKQIDYTKCPLCGHTKVITSPARDAKGHVIWVSFNGKTPFIQIREGGGKVGTGKRGRGHGRGYGFPTIAEYTFEQVLQSHMTTYSDLIDDLVDALVNLVKEAKQAGLISDTDLK